MTNPQTGQALATKGAPPEAAALVRTPDEFRDRLTRWHAAGYHVLSPFANFAALPAHYAIVPTMVKLEADPERGDVYLDKLFCDEGKGEVAIAKLGLSKIAMAAGMSIKTFRTDPRTIANLWEVRATTRFIGIDGTPQEQDATEEYDMRDGAARIRKFKPGQIESFRSKGLRHCEARAVNAAIRQFGIKQKYTRAELAKPFVILRIVYTPDLSDPATLQQVNERALAGSAALFPGTALPAASGRHESEPLDVIGDPSAGSRPPVIDVPKRPAARTIAAVEHDLEAGIYTIRLDGGQVVLTRDGATAAALLDAKRSGQRAAIRLEADEETIAAVDLVPGALGDQGTPAAAPEPARPAAPTGPRPQKLLSCVQARSGKRKDLSTWRQHKITTIAGEDWYTFEDRDAAAAQDAIARGWLVLLERAPINEDYPDQLDLARLTLIDPAQLELPGAEKH